MGISSKEIFGAEIQYFRIEPEYWEKIIKQFKDTGLKCISTYVQWSTHLVGPPDGNHPAGVLDFEGRTDPKLNLLRFIELVEKHGLNMNFRCGPFCCNEMVHGGYPEWLVMGYPGMMVWDYQNRTTQGYWIARKEGSQPSYLHPDYLEWCGRWIHEVDKIIIPHMKSKGGCITMVNLDNEVSYIVQDGFLSSDYNPVNVGRGGYYHQYLAGKYHNAGNLPYGKSYANIEDVPAPRSVPEEVGEGLAYYLDWPEFKQWVMCEYIRRLREMHRQNGVEDVIFMTNFNPHLPEGVPARMPAFEEAAGGIAGYDFYRGTFMSYSGYHSMARVLKLMNASLKYTWSAEFMAGTWNKDLTNRGRVSDEHTRFMTRCALAHGCKAISWFMFHDRDCWGDAPVSSHGHPRSNLGVLKEVPELLFGAIKDWDALVPQGDTAVVYDLVQHRHTYLGDPSPCSDNNLHVGKPSIEGVEAGAASREYTGLFRLIEQSGYQADVIDIMHSEKGLERYPAVFLPGSPVIERQASESLANYVKNGGVLVLSGTWPSVDETGRAFQFLGVEKPAEAIDKHVINVGKGRLIWHGQYIAQEEPEWESIKNVEFVADVLDSYSGGAAVSIRPVGQISWTDWKKDGGGHMLYRQPRNLASAVLHKSPGEAIVFAINHYPEAAKFEITFRDKKTARLTNLSSNEVHEVRDGKVVLDIDRKTAEIFRLE